MLFCVLVLGTMLFVLRLPVSQHLEHFSHICTAHAQERPFMNFRLKFWHHHSIRWSRFPYTAPYFGDTRTFSVNFCIG